MRIFVIERIGTPITQEERVYIEKELADITAFLADDEAIDKEVESCKADGLESFDRWLVITCAEADAWGMNETLKTGIVHSW